MSAQTPAAGTEQDRGDRRAPGEGVSGLTVSDLRVVYPNGAIGVDGVSLDVRPGRITAVLGRNGAGKTSLLTGLAGFLRSERVAVTGSARLGGVDVAGVGPARSNRAGLVLVPERDKVFPSLKVSENLALVTPKAAPGGTGLGALATAFPVIERRADSAAGMLSGGERQMLALAMAMVQRPRALLVDELSLGLAPVIVKQLMTALKAMADELGLPVLLVEQDAVAAMKVADDLYVLDRGRIAWQGPTGETSAAELGRRYLGVPT
ncbi:ABC transporter ATP-binding protein [Spirillospora sp. CA-108201]